MCSRPCPLRGHGGSDWGCRLEPHGPVQCGSHVHHSLGIPPCQAGMARGHIDTMTPSLHTETNSGVLLPTKVYSGPEWVTSDMQFARAHGRLTHVTDISGAQIPRGSLGLPG